MTGGMKGMSSHFSDAGHGKRAPGADPKSMVIIPRKSLYPLALIVLTGARFLQIRTLLPVITPYSNIMNDLITLYIRFLYLI